MYDLYYTAKDVSKKAITVEAIKNMSNVRDTMLRYNISRVVIVNNDKPVFDSIFRIATNLYTELISHKFLKGHNKYKPPEVKYPL